MLAPPNDHINAHIQTPVYIFGACGCVRGMLFPSQLWHYCLSLRDKTLQPQSLLHSLTCHAGNILQHGWYVVWNCQIQLMWTTGVMSAVRVPLGEFSKYFPLGAVHLFLETSPAWLFWRKGAMRTWHCAGLPSEMDSVWTSFWVLGTVLAWFRLHTGCMNHDNNMVGFVCTCLENMTWMKPTLPRSKKRSCRQKTLRLINPCHKCVVSGIKQHAQTDRLVNLSFPTYSSLNIYFRLDEPCPLKDLP